MSKNIGELLKISKISDIIEGGKSKKLSDQPWFWWVVGGLALVLLAGIAYGVYRFIKSKEYDDYDLYDDLDSYYDEEDHYELGAAEEAEEPAEAAETAEA